MLSGTSQFSGDNVFFVHGGKCVNHLSSILKVKEKWSAGGKTLTCFGHDQEKVLESTQWSLLFLLNT